MRAIDGAREKLVESWRSATETWLDDQGPYIHPGDTHALQDVGARVFDGGLEEFQRAHPLPSRSPGTVHTGVPPIPYMGDLENAKVVLLMLNPRFTTSDYFLHRHAGDVRAVERRNIRQDFETDEFPMASLNPRLSYASGFSYWTQQGRFGWMVEQFCKRDGLEPVDALRHISQNVAVLQYVPYRSRSYSIPRRISQRLTSSKLAVGFATSLARGGDDSPLIIAFRKQREWGVDVAGEAGVLKGNSRGAFFGPESQTGQAIFRRLRSPR